VTRTSGAHVARVEDAGAAMSKVSIVISKSRRGIFDMSRTR